MIVRLIVKQKSIFKIKFAAITKYLHAQKCMLDEQQQ